MVDHDFCPDPVSLFAGILIPPIAPKVVCRICTNHIKSWTVAVWKLPSQPNVAIMPTSNRPVIIDFFLLSSHGRSKREISKIVWVSYCVISKLPHHWNGNVVILMKFSSLAALEVVILTTSGAASDDNFVNMTTFPIQWFCSLCHQSGSNENGYFFALIEVFWHVSFAWN